MLLLTASWASYCSVQSVSSAVFAGSNSYGSSFNFYLTKAIHSNIMWEKTPESSGNKEIME